MSLSRLKSSPPRSGWTRVLTAMQLLVIRRLNGPFMVFQLDAVAYPGNSGSPLYDVDTGRVIGVMNSVYIKKTKETAISSPSGISYATPVDYIRALLKKAGVGQ